MNQDAMGDRSVVANNVHHAVIITGDQNSVAVTINEAAPRVPSLLPGPEALAGQLDASRLFHHGHPLVGRDAELAALVDALHDPSRRVIVLPARGGTGKTRILLELDDRLSAEGMTVRWLSEAPLDAAALAEVPVGPAAVIVDDAHRHMDLLALLQSLARRPDVTLVVATRPHALRRVQEAARQAGHDDTSLLTLSELGPLDQDSARALAAAAAGRSSDDSVTLGDSTAAFPLLTVVGGHLLARERLRPAQLAGHDAYREQILARWADESVGTLREDLDRTVVRRTLATLAALAPYREAHTAVANAVAEYLGVRRDELIRMVGELETAGLLARRGGLLRVAPDVLADELLRREAVSLTGQPTGFVEAVVAAFPGQVTTILRNVAEVDYRLRVQGQDVDLLSAVWKDIRDAVLSEGAVGRQRWLEALAGIGYYQPERTIELVEEVLSDPVEPETVQELFGLHQVTQHDVGHAIAPRLGEVAHHLDHVPVVCDLLWRLGRDDNCHRQQRADHPLKVLSTLAGYEVGKPLSYQQAVVDRVVAWLADDPSVGAAGTTPLGLLQPMTAKGGTTTRSSGWALEFGSFFVSAAATEPLRHRVRDLAATYLVGQDLRLAVDAVVLLEGFLREPVAFFGGTVPADIADSWRDEQLAVLGVLQQAAGTGGLQPIAALFARQAVWWQARHGTAAVRVAARSVWQIITDHYLLDLLVEISGSTAVNDEDLDADPFDHEAAQGRAAARRERLVDELLSEHAAARLLAYLEGLCGLFEDAGKGSVNPAPLLWRLAERAPERGAELAELLAQGPDRPLTWALRPLLAALVTVAPDRAVEIAHEALDDESLVKARAVAGAWAWASWAWTNQELRAVFERVVRHCDPITRSTAVGPLRTLAHDNPPAAIAAALEVRIDSSVVAEEIAALLVSELHDRGHPLRDPEAVKQLLNSLKPLGDLGGYWTGELLRRLAREHLLVVTKFLLDRINLARDQPEGADRLEAIPFEWRAAPEDHRVAELPAATEALQLVRDAMLEPDWAHEWWIPQLFTALADGYGDLALDVLREFIISGDESRVLAAARLLTGAPSRFVLDRAPYVDEILVAAHGISGDCLSQVKAALHGSAFGGTRTRTPGEPDPKDVRLRDRARELATTLPPGLTRSFYQRLTEDAERDILDDLRGDDERRL